MKTYSVVIPGDINKELLQHLIREDRQEDMCFATYLPSQGSKRMTAIIQSIILPMPDEREVHGNVAFLSNYFERVLGIANERKEGIVILHSHPATGWQGMSNDDIVAEKRIAPPVYGLTKLPLLGLTLGTDGSWSARFWMKDNKKKRFYNRKWCETVRVIGDKLLITYDDNQVKPHIDSEKQLRTISAWGKHTQEDLSRIKIGIVGLGSVGSMVSEILARTGISNFTLIDFDSVELKNLDRLSNVFKKDIGRAKVLAVRDGIKRSATSPKVTVSCNEHSLCEEAGFIDALNCDIIFSCVDRPWPRQILNFISYAHLIPVIDGGIFVRTNKTNTRLVGAEWKAQTVGFNRPCLECLGQYSTSEARLEKDGLLDDPKYINEMEESDKVRINAHENVFAFSSYLASMEVIHLLNLFVAPEGFGNIGQQVYHLLPGKMKTEEILKCKKNCFFPTIMGKGDNSGINVYGLHDAASKARQKRGLFKKKAPKN